MTVAEIAARSPRPGGPAVGIKQGSLIGLTLLAIVLTGSLHLAPQPDPTARAARETAAAGQIPVAGRNDQKALDAYGNLPLAFVPNDGQTDALVRFSAQTVGAHFHFTETEAVFAFDKVTPDQDRGVALRLGFQGANPGTRIEGQGLLTGKVNYLIGNDPNEWHTNLPTYGQVVYRDLWPGVDMVFRGDASRLKYEFLVRPGARVQDIQLAYRGAGRLSVNKAGQLLIGTSAGTLTDVRPLSYQAVGGKRVPVKSRFLLRPDTGKAKGYGFAVGHYDLRRPLVIDPGLLYSTYLGGDSSDIGNPIAVDGSGNAYVTGVTESNNFPTTAGAFDTTQSGVDAFVTKLNTTGTAPLVYSTYLGGSGADRGRGIALDGAGSAYVTGVTESNNFPTTAGAFDTTQSGSDAFVTKLNATGTAPLLYSTYLGGSGTDRGLGIAVDGSGSAYVTGETDSSNFPTTTGAFDTIQNGVDAFVTKLNPTGTAPLLYSTYLGGSGADRGFGIDVDGTGNAYVTGRTESTDFPTTTGAFDTTYNSNGDAFVTKLDMIGAPATLTLSPTTDTNPVGTSHTVTATVRDIAGNPVPGVIVRFSVTGANTASGSATTNASGQATFTYTGNNAGVDQIHAFADTNNNGTQNAGEPFGDATKTWTAAAPAMLTLTPTADTNPVGTSHTVTATVTNAAGGPVANVTVRFTVTGSVNTSGQCTTNTAGQCDFTYSGPTTPGADAITAFADTNNNGTQNAGEPVGAAEKTWTPGAPATLVLEPAADTNPVGTDHTVTATVRDAFTNPTPGITVRFTVTGSVSTTGQCTTNTAGQCDFTYSGPTTPGADAITAFADTNNNGTQNAGEPVGAAEKTWTPGAPATLVLEPAADTNPVGTDHTVTATVRDAFTNPTPGITVRFTVTGSVNTSGQCTTNTAGQCDFTYSGPTTPGADAITAFADTNNNGTQNAGEPVGAAEKTCAPGAPATLVLEPAADTNPVGTDHTVTATVRDAFTNPTPGITVRFTVTGSVNTSGQCTTNTTGQCDFTYSGPTTPGADAITAFADTNNNGTQNAGEPVGAAEKTCAPGAPATLVLEPAADTNPVGTDHTVTATVRDAFTNPTPGITV